MKKVLFVLVLVVKIFQLEAQSLGGNAVFNFLNQPNTPQLSALGGVNISNITIDIGMSFHNPALMRENMHGQVNASFTALFAGIKNYSAVAGWHSTQLKTNIAVGVNFLHYGNIAQTDAAGNVFGHFKPRDYVAQVQLSRRYKEKWFYGATGKFVSSHYGQFTSNGIAADIGIAYFDSSKGLQFALVAKNFGTQLKKYDVTRQKEELPFDVQAGVTKRLANAPVQLSLTAHHLHEYNLQYNDTAFNRQEAINSAKGVGIGKLLSHFVIAAQVFVNEKIEISAGYNLLRRKDLNAYNAANGLNGFTMGAGLLLKHLQLRYATGFYQRNMFNQFGLSLNMFE